MIKNDAWIAKQASQGMIAPFVPTLTRRVDVGGLVHLENDISIPLQRPAVSFGRSSYGYDIRLSAKDFRIFRHIPGEVVDPKHFNPEALEPAKLHSDDGGDYFILPAHSYGLGVAVERLEVPANITVLCIGKSTYARCGIIANCCPAESGWHGHLTLEFSNASSADCRIYANEGVVQLLFFEGEPCEVSYETRQGKYQGQLEQVTLPRV